MRIFDTVMDYVLEEEGPDSDRPDDKGGFTHYGIAINRHPELTRAELASWDRARCIEWYRANYWNRVAGDKLPAAIALAVMDSAVNQGVGTAAKLLQRAVRIPENEVDGAIGTKTLLAVGGRHWREVLVDFQALRAVRYAGDSTFSANGKGWMRRLFKTDQTAVALAAAGEP